MMARQQIVENILKENEVPFEFRSTFPISKVVRDPEAETQVRQSKESAPPKEVQQYAAQLRAGADFPPIVVRKADGMLIDGNTRYEAHVEDKREVIPAYLVDIQSPKVMKRLAIAINQTQGKRCSRQDILNYLEGLNGSVDREQFVRDTGWSKTSLVKYLAVKETDRRLEEAEVKPARKIDDAVKAHINTVRQTRPFVALHQLAQDTAIKAGEMGKLVKAVLNADSEDAMLGLVQAERDRRQSEIEEIRNNIPPSPAVAGLIGMHCGWIVKQGATRLNDRNLASRDESHAWLLKAHRTLGAALRLYDDEDAE